MIPSFLNGGIAVASAVITLQYLKAWRRVRDQLFLLFALAFLLLTIERVLIEVWAVSDERQPLIYCLRLLTFVLIASGVVHKNITKKTRPRPPIKVA
jgi:NADH:ubiquinone oxidoreductase subunit 3 (subunit A)